MKIKYVGNKPLWYPRLSKYPRGIEIKKGMDIEVTEYEAETFLKLKNGKMSLWERQRQPKIEEVE